MPQYKAPIRDMQFVMKELLDYPGHYRELPGDHDIDGDLIDAVMGSAAEFAEEVLAPINASGDAEGCKLKGGEVMVPEGFKKAYEIYCEGGWAGLAAEEEFGGQGLPASLSLPHAEMNGSANWSWSMYPGLTHGATATLEAHGTDEQKAAYLPPLVEGRWSGTMCLTESHCGSDLSQVQARAVPQDDGSYKITGSKIFISCGEHDLTENIVHIVLARLPDAPPGTKGISLFIVPKFLVLDDGSVGERNQVVCTSIEKKMGIHGSVTAVLAFEEATGFLVGPPNRGLNCMFTFINISRIGNAVQGVSTAESSLQGALAYARERKAMRSLTGPKNPDDPADPIIVHPDVRRMLLTQKAIAEGGRAMVFDAARIADYYTRGETEEARKKADKRLGLLTPILKGFLTEMGCEAADLGIQVFGGHGYIREMGMEQIYRDVRISTIYEGTTGIQSLDLLGRKIMLDRAKELDDFLGEIKTFCNGFGRFRGRMKVFTKPLRKMVRNWDWSTKKLMFRALKNRDVVGSAAYDYLMFTGFVVMGYYWARMAALALKRLEDETCEDKAFYKAKLQTAYFYFDRLFPRARMHLRCARGDVRSLTAMEEQHFHF
ncbi:MAG: acyl-CoA dehydrogenase C-terminal domain-containing protein [Acidobacteriota bacterium]|nr:acyl-CoA dehydrogenase C-terminal domain-containing protein [Acidobacteriota bacterium]